jgi:hypothetical protein
MRNEETRGGRKGIGIDHAHQDAWGRCKNEREWKSDGMERAMEGMGE